MSTRLIHVEELASRSGAAPTLVVRLVRLGLVEPADGETERYEPWQALRVQRMLRLRRDLGVNFSGAALVLDLVERIEELEAELRLVGRRT